MSDEQPRSEQFSQIAQAELPTGIYWGDPITPARAEQLRALADQQHAWTGASSHPGRESSFTGVRLTGAEVFWLAAYTLAGLQGDLDAAQEQLRLPPRDRDIDLSALHIEGANLDQAHLERAYLFGAHLEGADLRYAHLEGGVLDKAHLEGADLGGACLEETSLGAAHLEGAGLFQARLEGANLFEAHLERTNLRFAHLEGAELRFAHLERATLGVGPLKGARLAEEPLKEVSYLTTHLEGANLDQAHLEGAILGGVHLERANLRGVHLEHAYLHRAHLEGADLREATLDLQTHLEGAVLSSRKHGSAKLGRVKWGGADLSGVNWRKVKRLGDERLHDGNRFRSWIGAKKHREAVRAYRRLSVALRTQGLTEEADRFTHRAQVRQRAVLLRELRLPQYLGSWLLALLAGYGYRPRRTILLYLALIAGFAATYFAYGTGCHISAPSDLVTLLTARQSCTAHPLTWKEAFVISLTAFHGRGFFVGTFKPSDPQAAVAAAEAVVGLLLEVSFIATVTQRFFAR